MFGETFRYTRNGASAFDIQVIPRNINCHGGPVYPRLTILLLFKPHANRGLIETWLHLLQVGLSVEGFGPLAEATPIQLHRQFNGAGFDNDFTVTVEFPLDLYRAKQMELARKGDMVLNLNLRLGCTAIWGRPLPDKTMLAESPHLEVLYAPLRIVVSQSDWISNVLPGLGVGKVQLIELPFPEVAASPELQRSVKALADAQERLKLGYPDDVPKFCRQALEPFWQHVPKEDGSGLKPKLKSSWETRLGEVTYQWLEGALGAVKWIGNKAAHDGIACSRPDAEMLLIVTTTLVAYASRVPDAEDASG